MPLTLEEINAAIEQDRDLQVDVAIVKELQTTISHLKDIETESFIMKFPSPKTAHLGSEDFNHLYEPAEDTFLLMDAIEGDLEHLANLKPALAMEIGCGSGVVLSHLGIVLKAIEETSHEIPCHFVGIDINPRATNATYKTGQANKIPIDTITSDLHSALRFSPSVGFADVILFNPPYVPTSTEEINSSSLARSWAGGVKGREVTDRILPDIGMLLTDGGTLYMIALPENDLADLTEQLSTQELEVSTIVERRAGPEHLKVLKAVRRPRKNR
eukprot:Clim_evm94s153 gene=Clim_evmTU94s153